MQTPPTLKVLMLTLMLVIALGCRTPSFNILESDVRNIPELGVCQITTLDGETGEPLVGTRVVLNYHDLTQSRTYITDNKGFVRLYTLPGKYLITQYHHPDGQCQRAYYGCLSFYPQKQSYPYTLMKVKNIKVKVARPSTILNISVRIFFPEEPILIRLQ